MKKSIDRLDAEQAWQEAGKLLDKHFRRKKIVYWSFLLLIAGAIGSGVLLMSHHRQPAGLSSGTGVEKLIAEPVQIENQQPVILASQAKDEKNGNASAEIVKPTFEKEKSSGKIASGPLSADHSNRTHSIVAGKKVTKNEISKAMPGLTEMHTPKQDNKEITIDNTREMPGLIAAENNPAGNSEMKNQPEVRTNPVELNEKQGAAETRSFIPDMHVGSIAGIKLQEITPVHEMQKRDDGKTPCKHDARPELNLLFTFSADYVSKSLSSSKYTDYVKRRSIEEHEIVTPTVGAGIRSNIGKFAVTGGVEYSTWGEKTIYSPYLNKLVAIENGNFQTYLRTDTDTIYIQGNQHFNLTNYEDSLYVLHYDSIRMTTEVGEISSVRIAYQHISIPVEFSYRIIQRRLGIGATIGFAPAFILAKKGTYLQRDLSGTESVAEIKAVNKVIYSGRFSIDLFFRPSNRLTLMIRPQFRKNLNSLFQKEYGVNQLYYSTGLGFGLLYAL